VESFGLQRNPHWGQWGQGGATKLSTERKRAETLLLGSRGGGSGEASRRFRGVAAFRRCWRVGGLMKRGTKKKKGGRYAEPWVPVQEGRERQACLARPGKGGEASRYRYRFGFLSRAKAFFEVRFCDTPLILAVPLASEFSSAPRISAMRSVAPAASRVFALLLER
jgi:hypothetical protein